MDIVSSNLISVITSILICLTALAIYRFLDKNNRSMEKIKRYGDKIKENLSAFVDERTNDIRNLAIDIQVNLKTGKEIIKRIREVEDNLDNRAQQMVTIQDKLSDYDTILKNLDIATGEADENLHRLTEESRVIETFRKQLREASGKMNEMQKAIPLIQNELHQKNTTELQQVASQIKNDAVSYVTALQGKVEKSDKMVKDFALYLSRLEAKRESMEQETARNLKKIAGSFELEAQEMKSRLMGDFNTGLASSLSDVKAKSEDVKKELFEFMDASDIKLSTLEEGFKKKIHTFKETTATIGNNFQKGLDNIIALGKTSQDKMMQKFKSLIRENEDKVKMEVEKRIGTINHEFDAGKEQLMKELAKSRNSLESWKITMAADLKKAQEDNKKKFDELAVISHSAREGIYKTLEEKTSSFESSFNARVDEALKKVKSVDAVRAEFAQKINEFHKEMDVFSQEMGTRIDTMRDESLGKLSGTAESMELTIVNAVEKRMEEYEKDFNYRFQKLENLNHDVEDFDANLKSYIEGRKVEFKQELDKYIQFVGTERTREQEKTEQLFTKIHSEIKNLEQGLMQLKAEAYQDVSEKLKGFEDDFFSDLKTRLSKMEENLTHYKDNITRKLEDITEMNVKERIDIEAKYNEEIMSKLNLVRENTKTEVERIQSWISDLDTKMKDNSTVWDETIETFNRRIEEEWDSKTMESGVVFERKFKAFEQNINDMLAACRNDMETRITAYSTQLEQDRGGYKEYFDSAKNDLEEWENDMNRKLAESRNRLAENIDSMKSELDQHMRSFKSEYFAQQQEIVDSSRDERDSIKQEIEDLSGRIKGLDDGFNAKTRLLHENLQKEYSVQNEELNKSIEEIGASFEDKFKVFEKNMNEMLSVCRNDVESRIAAYSNQIEQDRNSYKNYFDVAKESLVVWEDDMNKKIADTRAKITSNTQSLKLILDEQIKTVKADIDSQQEEILDSTREERDQIRQEITDLSARLGEFDDGFNTRTKFLQENLEKEYTERSTEFNRTVEEMKVSFERKVDTVWQNVAKDIHDNAEKWQKELGMLSDSGEKIRNELSQINEKQAECREKYAEFITIIDGMEVIEKDFNTVRQEIDLFKDEVNHLEPEMAKIKSFEASFSQTREKTEELTREIDRMSVEIENKFNKISSDSDLAREQIEEVLRSYEERIETWQQQQTGRLNEYLDDLDDRTESFKKNVKATIKDMENEFLSRKDEYTKIAETDKKNLEQEMSKLVIEVMNLGNDLVEKKNYALDALAEDYERLQQEFAGKSRLFHDSIDEKMQLFSQNFEENLVKSETAQKKNLEKLEERYKTLTTGIAEIDKKQKNFVEQTKLFERADKLKDRLSNDIEEIKKDIIKLEPDKKKLSELEIEMNRVKKFSEDISTRFSKFLTDRRRIENMEKDFSRLIKYSEEIESKLKDMTGAHDQLQVIQIKLKEIENLENSIGTQYDRLEKKNAILDNTARGVDKGFQMLSDLENNIKTLSENFNELPPKVISMKEEIKFLLENKHKTDSAIEQLNSLEGVMTNLEERMLKMQTAREWLSRTETRLESIGKQASEQVKLLHSLVKEKVNEMNKKGAPPLDIRQTILQLASQGWKVHEIARATEVSQGEVELILELAPQTR